MNLEDLGNIGEFIGGIGVVISFLFLAWQIRQNSKTIKAQIRQSHADNAVHGTMQIASNPDLRRVIHKVNTQEKLSADEHIVWWGYLYSSLHLWENKYTQVKMGTIPQSDWEVEKHPISEMPLHRRWLEIHWEAVKGGFDPGFSAEIDRILAGRD